MTLLVLCLSKGCVVQYFHTNNLLVEGSHKYTPQKKVEEESIIMTVL